ncbi:hypothetical protein [Nocardioides acrostichi]|uniref:Uncharacterized protein n=1 Tax=Nocardioides acrostichi TaxID=2784339 RepID=A0A930UZL2_9ACTN|nr:hypothetical protein [Nocardioides acrostichi]MBF4161950.1 hypothetical protein [Nocardioides acrostichi]
MVDEHPVVHTGQRATPQQTPEVVGGDSHRAQLSPGDHAVPVGCEEAQRGEGRRVRHAVTVPDGGPGTHPVDPVPAYEPGPTWI